MIENPAAGDLDKIVTDLSEGLAKYDRPPSALVAVIDGLKAIDASIKRIEAYDAYRRAGRLVQGPARVAEKDGNN